LKKWKELRRIVKPGATILVQDLARPQLLKDLFFYSLRASLTVGEIQEQLYSAGLKALTVRMSSERHWEVSGKAR
jgi:hypothetical protein